MFGHFACNAWNGHVHLICFCWKYILNSIPYLLLRHCHSIKLIFVILMTFNKLNQSLVWNTNGVESEGSLKWKTMSMLADKPMLWLWEALSSVWIFQRLEAKFDRLWFSPNWWLLCLLIEPFEIFFLFPRH